MTDAVLAIEQVSVLTSSHFTVCHTDSLASKYRARLDGCLDRFGQSCHIVPNWNLLSEKSVIERERLIAFGLPIGAAIKHDSIQSGCSCNDKRMFKFARHSPEADGMVDTWIRET